MWIEETAGQGDAFCAHLNATICKLIGVDGLADETAHQIVDRKPYTLAVVLQRQILGDIAFVAQTEDFGEAIRLSV